jgi:peptidoglycan/xylan/chitin deacetylase (PgdA/CDA1 family)
VGADLTFVKTKLALLQLSKAAGLFWIARRLTRSGLRILCYHGFALEDESSFHPKLFITAETFKKRLRYLRKHQYLVFPLSQALELLDRGQLPPGSIVITIDDGFYGTNLWALDSFRQFGFPATIFVTTYYSLNGGPVFRLCVQYMFWKSAKDKIKGSDLGLDWLGEVAWRSKEEKKKIVWEIIRHGETACDEKGRRELCRRLGHALGVDYDQIVAHRLLSIVNPDEIRQLAREGMEFQLHTHRHHFPLDRDMAIKEIRDNRAALEQLVDQPLQHFCYPSGIWSEQQWAWLAEEGIRSATTCIAGLNYADTCRYALRRFLDGEDIAAIQFEAEVSGFLELVRRVRTFINRLLGREVKLDAQPAYP